jgi:hypothetical protein
MNSPDVHAETSMNSGALQANKNSKTDERACERFKKKSEGKSRDRMNLKEAHWGLGLPQSTQDLLLRSSRLMRS